MQEKARRAIVALLLAAVAVTPLFAAGTQEMREGEEATPMVLFFPFANTSTPEAITEVGSQIESAMADDGLAIDLQWIIIPRESFGEKLNVILASGEQLDGGIGDGDDFWEMNQRPGLVRPIADLLEEHGPNLLSRIPQTAWDTATNAQGLVAGIPSYSRYYWQGAVIRRDWLDQLGLDMPETLAELESTMEAFRANFDNVIPAGGDAWYMEPFLMSAVTGDVTPNVEWETVTDDDRVVQAFTHPDYVKFLELYNRWIDNGWWNKDFLVTDSQQNDQLFLSGRMGILFTDPHNAERYNRILQTQEPDAEVSFLRVPSGPAGGPAFGFNAGTGRYVWITNSSQSPEAVIQYFDWQLASPENYRLARLGIEGEHWIDEGETWALPPEAEGDPSRRAYFDVYAPLAYEFFDLPRADVPEAYTGIDEYYASLPVVMPKLFGFVADWEEIGDVSTIDIWGGMYNIAVGARPLDEWDDLVEEYYDSGAARIYDTMTAQYRAWLAEKE